MNGTHSVFYIHETHVTLLPRSLSHGQRKADAIICNFKTDAILRVPQSNMHVPPRVRA
ncbi:MAG: hypothetical protein HC853_12555 [Anaerolineae bacterium]|nr:hypothetical protein [Anaerolineae bacterium]